MFNVYIIYIFPVSVQLLLIGNEKVKTLWCFVKPESLNLLYPDQLHKGKLWNETKLFTIKNKSLEAMFFIQMKNTIFMWKSLSLKSKHEAVVFLQRDVIYAMRPMKDKNGLLVSIFSGCWLRRQRRLISRGHNYFRCISFQNVWLGLEWGANIVNILIVTLNLTIADATWEEIKYGTKSKRVAFVTVSHIFANLSLV